MTAQIITFPICKTRKRGTYSLACADIVQLPGTQKSSPGLPTQAQVTDAFRAFRKAAERRSKPSSSVEDFTELARWIFENKIRGKT
jgi:hypothetical protein